MKKLTKWFIATFAGVSILFSSCVDQIKFGDSFLEKAPDTGDMNQDTIFGKADYARAFLWKTYSKLYYGLATNWNDVDGKMNTGMFETMSDCWHSHNSWDGVTLVITIRVDIKLVMKMMETIPVLTIRRRTVGKRSVRRGCLLRM